MWTVEVFGGQRRRSLRVQTIGDRVPSLPAVLVAAQKFGTTTRLIEQLNREAALVEKIPNVVSCIDGIQNWSRRVGGAGSASDVNGEDRLVALGEADGALGRFSSSAAFADQKPDSIVWHDHTAAIVEIPEGSDEITIEYQPELSDVSRAETTRKRFFSSDHTVETVLDARVYHRDGNATQDHWRRMRANGSRFLSTLGSTAGFVVLRVVRRIVPMRTRVLHDPTFNHRQRQMLSLCPEIARACPDLGQLSIKKRHDRVIVFVHGTVSCGLQSLKNLCVPTPSIPVYRFEHDTFLQVSENADELVSLMTNYLEAEHLLLVAHSRGGLVGRLAMNSLAKQGRGSQVSLLTFGTPHEGTPLVNLASGVVNLLIRLGSSVVPEVPLMSPAIAGLSYLHASTKLPPGIDIMRINSELLRIMNAVQPSGSLRCWGSRFDPEDNLSGFGVGAEGSLLGFMSDVDNDLVVPTSSALAFGHKEPVLTCSHVRYFEQESVKRAIFEAAQSSAFHNTQS